MKRVPRWQWVLLLIYGVFVHLIVGIYFPDAPARIAIDGVVILAIAFAVVTLYLLLWHVVLRKR